MPDATEPLTADATRRALAFVVACFVAPPALVSCAPGGSPPNPRDAGPDAALVEHADCAAPVGGPSWWPLESGEGTPGYDDELHALDLEALPATIELASESEVTLSVVAYALEVTAAELGTSLDRDATLARGNMGRAVLGAAAVADPSGADGVDFAFLRRGLHRYYACERALPLTLDGFFASVLDHRDLPSSDVTESRPKGGVRRLYEAGAEGVYVAETIAPDGSVRETEILLEGGRADGALDFVVYDRDGDLADRSEFSTTPGNTIIGAAPYTCMTCHRDNWRYDKLVPELP